MRQRTYRNFIIFSHLHTTVPEKWENLDKYLYNQGLEITSVKGDGFCMLSAIACCFLHDMSEVLTVSKMKQKITDYLVMNGSKYTEWYSESVDQLVYDTTEFFSTGNYNQDICDLIMKICADTFGVTICVYQKSKEGQIQILKHSNPESGKVINLKFAYNPTHNEENHYDAITLKRNMKIHRVTSSEIFDSEELIDLTCYEVDGEECPQPIDLTLDESPQEQPIDLTLESSKSETTPHENTTETDQLINTYLKKMHQGVQFPFHFFDEAEMEEVTKLPTDVNGLKKYKIPATVCNYHTLVKDRRWFKMSKSSTSSLNSIRRVGKCQGSYKCQNPSCSFLSTQGEENVSKFNNYAGLKTCHSCGNFAKPTDCPARKLVEFIENEAAVYVYHIGTHTCDLKPDRHKFDYIIREEVEKNKTLGPKKLKMKLIKEKVDSGKFEDAKEVAEVFSDSRRVKIIRQDVLRGEQICEPNSMEAVAEVKKGSDTIDPMHIYRINSSLMNNDPDYVFKTSRAILEIALLMDQDGQKNSLQDELCFFDGAHSRVNNFVALAAWVLHPSMRMLFRLASMEVKSESHRTVELFWDMFNQCLRQVKKEVNNEKEIDHTYKFNPKGWMVDEAGSNFKGMEKVFGEEATLHKMKTCQWHFLHQAQTKAKLTGDYEEEVLLACKRLCTVTTVLQYELIMKRLYEIAAIHPRFKPFLDWWDARRYHVFAVFRAFSLPGVNLAEIGNAAWKRSGKISLVEAARDDITTMLLQEREYMNFKRKDVPGPVCKGPNDKQKAVKARKRQINSAKEVSEMLQIPAAVDAEMNEITHPEFFKPNSKAKHKQVKKGNEGKKRKRSSQEPCNIAKLICTIRCCTGTNKEITRKKC